MIPQEELEINIAPKLKRMTRIIEKTLLKGRDSVAHVKDIVRAMAIVKSMDAVAILLDIFCELHKAGLITMVRVKERFLESPSKGGWRGLYRQSQHAAAVGGSCRLSVCCQSICP